MFHRIVPFFLASRFRSRHVPCVRRHECFGVARLKHVAEETVDYMKTPDDVWLNDAFETTSHHENVYKLTRVGIGQANKHVTRNTPTLHATSSISKVLQSIPHSPFLCFIDHTEEATTTNPLAHRLREITILRLAAT